MVVLDAYLTQHTHRDMVVELLALSTAEDRLSFLMERQHTHAPLGREDRVDSRKVPGCLSGLWLKADSHEECLRFSAYSESDLVHGVVSFVCDLYSERSAPDILAIDSSLVDLLRLDGLLSTTRKRALGATMGFIRHTAQLAVQAKSAPQVAIGHAA